MHFLFPFLQQIPVNQFLRYDIEPSSDVVRLLLDEGAAGDNSPPKRYRYSLAKRLVAQWERRGLEIPEEFYEKYAACLLESGSDSNDDVQTTVVSYFVTRETPIRSIEAPNLIAFNGGTGYRTWEAALVLVHYLHDRELDATRVLELGCGTGIIGISCALRARPPEQVVLTDIDGDVLAVCAKNIALNDVADVCTIQPYAWGEPLESPLDAPPFDLIVGADITYDPTLVPLLVRSLSLLLKNQNNKALIACTKRNPDTLKVFEDECAGQQLACTVLETTRYAGDLIWISDDAPDVVIYAITSV
ncbi:hypothetical protein CANCADRAFT_44215 [Tortispora caseinolytica NRRL Y-17796]|uniref:FAM86 N-terminal domain-containing protein n=1 Tax=Tortispora caseinolytica NRRL Y-17796 TaxID=767744 RepID=A0A1E4TFN7_9ASCO|nr:hypothetical protein CANCADRAFT_44215 [Tortispora caseinolytica NRRL Y-17796]